MLRQSVKRPRATVADKLFFSMRYVNKRKHQTSRRSRRTRRHPSPTTPSTTSPASSTSGSLGMTEASYPPLLPYFFPHPQTYHPASSKGVPYRRQIRKLPLAAQDIRYWHQSGNLWSALPCGIHRPCRQSGWTGRRVVTGYIGVFWGLHGVSF
jgi:hypothetical protein